MRSRRVGKLRSGGHAAGSHGLRLENAGCGEGVAVRWQDLQTLHKCPTWVVSPVVELGVVESFTTPVGPDIYAMSVGGWLPLSVT
jgi:hypothetical protein